MSAYRRHGIADAVAAGRARVAVRRGWKPAHTNDAALRRRPVTLAGIGAWRYAVRIAPRDEVPGALAGPRGRWGPGDPPGFRDDASGELPARQGCRQRGALPTLPAREDRDGTLEFIVRRAWLAVVRCRG